MENVLDFTSRKELREWYLANYKIAKECWVKNCTRGKPGNDKVIYYLDAVEEALCFSWIDSVFKKVDGVLYQKFTPRSKSTSWTALNIARVKRLESLGLMSKEGLEAVPSKPTFYDTKIIDEIKNAGIYDLFIKLPILYQEIRINNLSTAKHNSLELYKKSFFNFVKKTKDGKLIPGWDDYGRLK